MVWTVQGQEESKSWTAKGKKQRPESCHPWSPCTAPAFYLPVGGPGDGGAGRRFGPPHTEDPECS